MMRTIGFLSALALTWSTLSEFTGATAGAAQRGARDSQSLTAGAPPVRAIRVLVDPQGGRLDWSRLTDQIVFGKYRASGDRRADIHVMRGDGSDQRCLTCGKADVPQAGNDQPAWHPSGRYIVFQSVNSALPVPVALRGRLADALSQGGAGFHNDLWVMTADGEKFYRLTNVRQGEATLHAHFSHDGRKLVWGAYERSDEDTQSEKGTGRDAGRGSGGRWQQGRARSQRAGGPGQWSLKIADFVIEDGPHLANTKSYRPRGDATTFYESHGFTPDDSKILFSASIGRPHPMDLDIWTLDMRSEQLSQLTDTPGVWDEHAHYSPSGQHIAWVSSAGFDYKPTYNYGKTLATELWVMNADGSHQSRLTYFNEPGRVETIGKRTIVADNAWNRDGTKIAAVLGVVDDDGDQSSRIALIDLASQY